jgi:hypothetical protein
MSCDILLLKASLKTAENDDRRQPDRQKPKKSTFLKVVFSNQVLNFSGLRQILHSADIKCMMGDLEPPHVCDKLLPPAHLMLCNHIKIFNNIPDIVPDLTDCPCKITVENRTCTTGPVRPPKHGSTNTAQLWL